MAETKISDRQIDVQAGWIPADETWTYASATTFTVAGDLTDKYYKGLKLQMTQTTPKYFYILSSSYGAPNTTVTVMVSNEYSIANAAITDNYYSLVEKPASFPTNFTFTPVWTSSGTAPSIGGGTMITTYSMTGSMVNIYLTVQNATSWGTGYYTWTLPTAGAGTNPLLNCPITVLDTGTNFRVGGSSILSGGSLRYRWDGTGSYSGQGTPVTLVNGQDAMYFYLSYTL